MGWHLGFEEKINGTTFHHHLYVKNAYCKTRDFTHSNIRDIAGVYALELAKQHVIPFSFHSSSPLA